MASRRGRDAPGAGDGVALVGRDDVGPVSLAGLFCFVFCFERAGESFPVFSFRFLLPRPRTPLGGFYSFLWKSQRGFAASLA